MAHQKTTRLEMTVLDDKELARDEYFRDHVDTYVGFMKAVKYGTVAVVVVLVLMALFLL
jgi:hypothetical protein